MVAFDANPIQSTDSIPFREMAKDFKGKIYSQPHNKRKRKAKLEFSKLHRIIKIEPLY